jgi:hypothetical protein
LAGPFVWLVWAALALALPAFVGRFSANVPIADDWELVPVLTGARPVTAAWLWEQHNEHRIPIPKLIHLALAALTGADYRAGMYFNCAALSAVAALLILTARRLRGRTSFADVFFPLALLHWGQSQNLLWSFQVQFVGSAALAGALLALIASARDRLPVRSAAVAALCLTALPLTGANGLGLVPALAVWLGYAGLVAWRAPGRGGRRPALVAWVGTAAALALVVVYFVGYRNVTGGAAAPTPRLAVEAAARFLATALGPAAAPLGLPADALVPVAAVLAALALVPVIARRPAERQRAVGFLCFLGALAALALGVGWGRALTAQVAGWGARNNRYVTLAVPLLCCLFFVGWLYVGRAVPWLLAGLMALLFVGNTLHGLDHGRRRGAVMAEVTADVRAGLPPEELGKKYASQIYFAGESQVLAERFVLLRQARQGPYRGLPDD